VGKISAKEFNIIKKEKIYDLYHFEKLPGRNRIRMDPLLFDLPYPDADPLFRFMDARIRKAG
jgi:hypothetical protein